MGSGIGAAQETVQHLVARGEPVGLLKLRLFRPFAADKLLAAIPSSVQKIAVLDRCKEPGSDGEPILSGTVELDEKYFGGKPRHKVGVRNCSPPYKKVASLSRYKQYKHHVNSSVKFRFFS